MPLLAVRASRCSPWTRRRRRWPRSAALQAAGSPPLEAAELFLADGLALVRAHTGLPAPFAERAPGVPAGRVRRPRRTRATTLLAALEEVSEQRAGDRRRRVGEDAPSRERLWRYREAHTESINAAGVPVKLDVAVPLGRLDRALARAAGRRTRGRRRRRARSSSGISTRATCTSTCSAPTTTHAVSDAVLRYVTSLGGSISAEHGVGRAKAEWLALSRSPAEIAAMRAIKHALDPRGLLNPGVILG